MSDNASLKLRREAATPRGVSVMAPLARIRAGERVLDVASGSGDLARAMAARGAVVCMSDINGPMQSRGRDRVADGGHLLPAVRCDAERLPFRSASFDCVAVGFGLRNMTHKDAELAEMARVLKPGGRLLVLEFSHIWKPLQKPYDLYSFGVLPWLGARVAGDSADYRYLAESIRMHPDQPTLAGMLERAGLEPQTDLDSNQTHALLEVLNGQDNREYLERGGAEELQRAVENDILVERGIIRRPGKKVAKCGVCWRYEDPRDWPMHEALVPRGWVVGRKQDQRDVAFHPCNSVLRHTVCPPTEGYDPETGETKIYRFVHEAGTGGDDAFRRCAIHLVRWETFDRVHAYLKAVYSDVPYHAGNAYDRFMALEGDTHDHESFIFGMHNLALQKVKKVLASLDLQGVWRILDLGGGPGTYAMALARKGSQVDHGLSRHPEDRAETHSTGRPFSVDQAFARRFYQR